MVVIASDPPTGGERGDPVVFYKIASSLTTLAPRNDAELYYFLSG